MKRLSLLTPFHYNRARRTLDTALSDGTRRRYHGVEALTYDALRSASAEERDTVFYREVRARKAWTHVGTRTRLLSPETNG